MTATAGETGGETDEIAAPALPRPGSAADLACARADLLLAGGVFAWITVVLVLDHAGSLWSQRLLGALTWALLLVLGGRERPLVRAQIGVVVVFATAVEYTFSPLLEVYTYRLDNVPAFVPPGHGLVYLCALAIGRTAVARRHAVSLVTAAVLSGGGYAAWGLLGPGRLDVLGACWYLCLLGFLRWGRSRLLYVGAFAVVTYLEILGTALGVWEWQPHDPTGSFAIGNPPSGAAGGYGWFDLAAILSAPAILRALAGIRSHKGR
jgi:hypothetical protein